MEVPDPLRFTPYFGEVFGISLKYFLGNMYISILLRTLSPLRGQDMIVEI